MNTEELIAKAREAGFTQAGYLDVKTLVLRQEVRDMCETNTCRMYNKRWSCPPGCGNLEELQEHISHYRDGLIVQTVGQLEDSMDVETMMETERLQKENLLRLRDVLAEEYPNLLTLGAGCCTISSECTYPDAPCRFPAKAISSMEAYGLVVSDVCQSNNMKYYYGNCTIAYTSCFLLTSPEA
jgi:predicted metal-binding protein